MKKKKVSSLSPTQLIIVFLTLSFLVGGISAFVINKFFIAGIESDIFSKEVAVLPDKFVAGVPVETAQETVIDREPLISSLVLIYKKKKAPRLLDQLYLPQDLAGEGFIFTSDGWLITSADIFKKEDIKNLTVEINQVMYNIEKKISDDSSGVAFIKINASNLSVSKLGESEKLKSGDSALVASRDKNIIFNFIANPDYLVLKNKNDLIFSSEKFNISILLQNYMPDVLQGSPVFNERGEVIGIIGGINKNQNVILPIDNWRSILGNILKKGVISRPYLGVHYLDVSRFIGFNKIEGGFELGNLFFKNLKGAYIYGATRSQGIEQGSPADLAGLKLGDLIIKVDDLEIDKRNRFNAIIQEYKPEDSVRLVIQRGKKEITLNIKLKKLKTNIVQMVDK